MRARRRPVKVITRRLLQGALTVALVVPLVVTAPLASTPAGATGPTDETPHDGRSFGAVIDVDFGTVADDAVAMAATVDGDGVAVASASGAVVVAGSLEHHGDASALELSSAVTDIALTPTGKGWWLVARDGGVFTFGDADFHGSVPTVLGPGQRLDRPITTMVATPTGLGYWLFAEDGGVFAFGDASFVGSLPQVLAGRQLNGTIVGATAAGTGDGYLLAGRDGGVFAFGDVAFHGSAAPEGRRDFVDISSAGDGYLLLASTGLVRAYGIDHLGNAAGPSAALAAPSDGRGYWVLPATLAAAEAGDKGAHVTALQQQLSTLGYWSGVADGSYGHLTSQAVMAFQKWEGLSATGRADAATITRLHTATRPTPASTSGDLVEIDLARQLMYVVRGGLAVHVFNTSTGSQIPYEHDGRWFHARTPTGRYDVYFERPNGWRVSHLGRLWRPKYFNGGIAIHGSGYIPAHADSHGCARLTTAAMDFFYDADLAPVGSEIWVY